MAKDAWFAPAISIIFELRQGWRMRRLAAAAKAARLDDLLRDY
jgi:hypothetical protein